MGSIEGEAEKADYVPEVSERERTLTETKMGKRLAYLLRYGAEKEGINVFEGGRNVNLKTNPCTYI